MAHELLRIREKLYNTPLLIDSNAFAAIDKYLSSRGTIDIKPKAEAFDDDDDDYPRPLKMNMVLSLGVIDIDGPLSYKPITVGGFDCGGANYLTIKQDFDTMIESGIKTIVLNISSPGGEAYQAFDTGRYLREKADEAGIRLIAYVDGLAASAAYVLAASAHEIISTSDSEEGSIGVFVKLVNDTKAMEQEGYETTYVKAGESKIPFDDNGGWRSDFIEDLQEKVNATYKEFTEYVAAFRGLSVQAVVDTQAKTFMAEDAMRIGLIDGVMTHELFQQYLESLNSETENGSNPVFDKLFSTKRGKEDESPVSPAPTKKEENMDVEIKEELAQAAAKIGELEDCSTKLAAVNKALEDQVKELSAALEAAKKEAEDAIADKKELVSASRKQELAKVLPADQVECVHASLASLDDAAFASVLAGFSATHEARAKADEFKELGHAAEAPEKEAKGGEKVVTRTEEILRARFKK